MGYCTLSGNGGPFGIGGGIVNFFGTVEVGNTVLYRDGGGETITNRGGTIISLGYNMSSDDGSGVLTNATDQINTDPMLGPLQDNGGPTFTHALLPGSPAIDAGDPDFTPPPDFDQRGPGFPRVACGRIDIGAFEVQDTTPPTIVCPTDMMTNATSAAGAVVSFEPTGSDNCSLASVNCIPASGSIFAIGTTTVTCEAIDDYDNTNTCSFTVTVVTLDVDGDGVDDDVDLCPDTAPGAIVDAAGCSIDQLVPCSGPRDGGTWGNHGQYVVSVVRTARQFMKAGLITREQNNAIVGQAAQSNCGNASNTTRDVIAVGIPGSPKDDGGPGAGPGNPGNKPLKP